MRGAFGAADVADEVGRFIDERADVTNPRAVGRV